MDKTEITYDSLCGMIESCIVPSSYKVLKDRKKMLVIAISEEVRFQKSIQKILKHNPEMEFIIVAQIGLQKVLEDVYRGRYPVIGWSGTYTAKLIDKVRKESDISGLDSFFYFTQHPVNLRDNNFINIAQYLQEEMDIHVYSDTVGYELYEYHNLALYSQGIKVYEEINRLIGLKFMCVTEENKA